MEGKTEEAGWGRQSLQAVMRLLRKGTEKQDWTEELQTVVHISQSLGRTSGER